MSDCCIPALAACLIAAVLIFRAMDHPREHQGARLQMRLSYSPAAHMFLFLVQWADCSLAGALGLLRVLVHYVYLDGTTTMSTQDRRASLHEFYAYIYPSLQQLQGGVSEIEARKQRAVCQERYTRRPREFKLSCEVSELDRELDTECGICMENAIDIALPSCNHAIATGTGELWAQPGTRALEPDESKRADMQRGMRTRATQQCHVKAFSMCHTEKKDHRRSRSESCPFCRDSLKRVGSGDLWQLMNADDVKDTAQLVREDVLRLFTYVSKLPTVLSDSVLAAYNAHLK
eukprot:SM000063S19984  [mRNA]  locus=s63:57262:58580:- [translate_table: standard]